MKNSRETLDKRNKIKREWKAKIDPSTFPRYIKRVCKDCGEEKDCGWNYTFDIHGKPEYRARCVECFKKYHKKVTTNNRQQITKHKREKNRERKQLCIDYKGGKCIVCGYSKSNFALTFHHKDKKSKEYSVSIMMDWSWENIIKELDKCDLMCFNCHMELHGKENDDVCII
jgi:hypothetical protein